MAHSNATILVVDDNPTNLNILVRRLTRDGYETIAAGDGLTALEAVRHQQVDLVLLDVMMPGISGLEVLQSIRRSRGLMDLPVIMVTGVTDSDAMVRALSLGANDYVIKPLDLRVVAARIETQLRMRDAAVISSGEFHKLKRDRERPRARIARFYCDRCLGAVSSAHDDKCAECGANKPRVGWAAIAGSPYPHLGRTVGDRFFLDRVLGRGSTGAVYRALHLDLARHVAAKVVDLGSGSSKQAAKARSRIEAEVEALVQLKNPHVVNVHDVVHLGDDVFALVMDFVKGRNLRDILHQLGRLSPHRALDVTRQVAQGLAEAHELGMIHRDIKPDNIMLERLPAGGYFARVLDFGIVHVLDNPRDSDGLWGTPLYTSPEQIAGRAELDHRADIYSLGCVVYHMLTGAPPFPANTVLEILDRHLLEPVPKLNAVLPDAPTTARMQELIDGMMQKVPAQRYQSLRDVVTEVSGLLRQLTFGADGELEAFLSSAERTARDFDEPGSETAFGMEDVYIDADDPLLSGGRRRLSCEGLALHLRPGVSRDEVVFCVTDDGGISRFSFSDGASIDVDLPDTPGRVRALANSQSGDVLALVYHTDESAFVQTRHGDGPWHRRDGLPGDVTCAAVNYHGSHLVVGSGRGAVAILAFDSDEPPQLLLESGPPVTALALDTHARMLAIAQGDGTLELHSLVDGSKNSVELAWAVKDLCFNRVGDLGAMLTSDQRAYIFTPPDGALVRRFDFAWDDVHAISFNDKDQLAHLATVDGELTLYKLQLVFDVGLSLDASD